MQKLWEDIKNLFTAPLVGEVDTVQLWALVGVVIVSLLIWAFIIRHIEIAATEV